MWRLSVGSGALTLWFGAALLVAGTSQPASAAPQLKVLYSFCSKTNCADGDQPYGGLALDASGRLLGGTGFGGKYDGGTVFALSPKGAHNWKFHTLKSICDGSPPNCQSAQGPSTTLIEDVAGNIYGTLYFGGENGKGAVFQLRPTDTGKYKLKSLHNFDGSDGAGPWELTYAGASTGAPYDGTSPLYSTTVAGGSNNAGTVFSLTPQGGGTWSHTTLYNFCGCSDGGLPYAGVIVDKAGNLFGTASYNGTNNAGVVYELANINGSWTQTVLYTFCSQAGCVDGNGPLAGIAADTAGNLYGTTYFGGANNVGVLFKLVPTGGQYSVLHDFCAKVNCADGSRPAATVTIDATNNVLGTTGRGGDQNYGTVFEFTGGKFKRLYSFCVAGSPCIDGGYPYGTLVLNSAGHIFGTTQFGGANIFGEAYELIP